MLKRAIIYLIGFLLFLQVGFAQNKKTDSLILVLNANTNEDTVRAKILLNLAEHYVPINADTSRLYAEKALALSRKLIYKKGQALALKHIGRSYYDKKKNETVLDYWSQSLEIFKSINDSSYIANLLTLIGTIYSVDGRDAQAAKYYMDALAISEQINDSLRLGTVLVNMGGLYNHKESTKPKALQNYLRALPILEGLPGQGSAIGTTLANIGDIYLWEKMYDSSIYFSTQALSFNSKTAQSAFALTMLGAANDSLGNYKEALQYHLKADSVGVKFDNTRYQILAQLGLASVYGKMGNKQKAFESYLKAENLAKGKGQNLNLASVYKGLAELYEQKNDYFNAFRVQKSLTALNDTLFSSEAQKELRNVVYDYEINKKQIEVNLYKKEKDLVDLQLNRAKFAKNALIAGLGMVSLIIFILYRDYLNKTKTNKLLDSQKVQIQTLLSNILPDEVAAELQRDGFATPKFYESASVLFTDFKSFTKHADHMTPQEVIAELNSCFIAFDDIMGKYNLEKIKTIGDAYMCAGGIPVPDPDHYWNMIKAAKDIQATILRRNNERAAKGLPPWEIRIGIHVGPIVAGVVGKKKYAYDIWGSTVNIASRMESNGEPGQINISSATYELIKDKYNCSHRGKIYAKNVGDIDMYFLGEEIKKGESLKENMDIAV